MTNEVELLGNVVEFSIGLAGFSGVVAAFTNRSRWSSLERYRLINLLSCALVPAFTSLIALGLIEYPPTAFQNQWQLPSLVQLILIGGIIYHASVGKSRLPPSQGQLVKKRIYVYLMALLFSVVVVQALGFLGMLKEAAFIGFYYGLVTILIAGVVLFGVAILSGENADVNDSSPGSSA